MPDSFVVPVLLSVPHYVRTARATPAGISILEHKKNDSFIHPSHSACLFRQRGARSSLRSPCILSVSDQRSQRLRQRSTQARVSLELAKRMKSKYIALYKITIYTRYFATSSHAAQKKRPPVERS